MSAEPLAPLTFMNGCLPRAPLRLLVPALARAGFGAMSLWPNVWRHAQRRDGMSLRDMRNLLDDHGIRLTDVDAYRQWIPASVQNEPVSGTISGGVPLHEFLETCAAVGGSTIVAVHLAGYTELAQEIDGFAALCETAAAWGLRVALEFVAFGGITDVGHAWRIVEGAGQPNSGLVIDTWHHALGKGQGDPSLLRQVPSDRIFTIQLADGHRQAAAPNLHQAMYERLLPSEGNLEIGNCWRLLRTMGVNAPYGLEVFRSYFDSFTIDEIVQLLADRTRKFINEG